MQILATIKNVCSVKPEVFMVVYIVRILWTGLWINFKTKANIYHLLKILNPCSIYCDKYSILKLRESQILGSYINIVAGKLTLLLTTGFLTIWNGIWCDKRRKITLIHNIIKHIIGPMRKVNLLCIVGYTHMHCLM